MPRASFSRVGALIALASAMACTGLIGEPGEEVPSEDGPGPFGPGQPGEGPGSPAGPVACEGDRGHADRDMRRLSREELTATLAAVLGDETMSAPSVQSALSLIPPETTGDLVHVFDDAHILEHISGRLSLAQAIVALTEGDEAARGRIFGCASVDRSCAERFLATTATRLLRRPIDEVRAASFMEAFESVGGGAAGMRRMVAIVLQAPELAYHMDVQGGAGSEVEATAERFEVDSWTVASRLSYALTGEAPDEVLMAAAERGELSTLEQARQHAERLVETQEARHHFAELIIHWLELHAAPDPDAAVAEALGIDPVGLGAEARDELLEYATHMVLDREVDAQTLMTEPVGFPRSQRLADIYASAQATGDEPAVLAAGHGGLLLRAGTLLTTRRRSSPIHRGVYVVERVLCNELPRPSSDIVNSRLDMVDELDPQSIPNRDVVSLVTANEPCVSCHAAFNPVGFLLEEFDSFGRHRTEEVVYGPDGEVVARFPLSLDVGDVYLHRSAEPLTLHGAGELVAEVATSAGYTNCLGERLYTTSRLRDPRPEDACAIHDVQQALAGGGSVIDGWIASIVNEDLLFRSTRESQ